MREYFLLALAATLLMTQVAEARWFRGRLFNRRARVATAAAPATPVAQPPVAAPTLAPVPTR
jgi:hypothetical protein